MNVFELFATLGLDSSAYDKGLGDAEESASSFGSRLKSGLGTAAGVATGAIAATTAATVAGAKAFINGVSATASYGDEIDKMSQKMNMSAEAYQEWDFVMQHAGTSIQSMQAGIKTLSAAAETGNEAFEKLGMTEEQIAEMSGEELFSATITALQGVEDETQRTYLAGQLLGRGATELGALLNMTAEETAEMKGQVHELGGVLSGDAVKNAARFQDSLQNMQTSIEGVKNGMMADFLPSFATAMDGLSAIFSGTDVEGGLAQIEEGISGVADSLMEKAPQLLQIGGTILEALTTSITDNLPVLLEAAVPVIMELATGLIENLPALASAAIELVGKIATAIIDNLPALLNAAQQIILSLAQSLGQNANKIVPTIVSLISTIATTLTSPQFLIPLLQAGLQIILGLIEGIVTAIPMIIEQLPVIIENICNVLLEGLPLILDAGLQIFMGLVNALPTIIEALTEALPTIIELILNLIIQGLPMILEGAITLFMALIDALPTIITALITNLPNLITTIISVLINNIPTLINASIQLFMALITAIPTIIVELGKQLPTIITAIVNGLGEGISQIASVGGDLIRGLWEGISNMTSWIGEKLKGFGDSVVSGLKNFFGIASPSKLFRDQIGKNLALGIGEGFEDGMDATMTEMEASAKDMTKNVADAINEPISSFDINAKVKMKKEAETFGREAETERLMNLIDAKLSKIEIKAPIYIGQKKIDQQVVQANARHAVSSGGR